jgi:hypothetical protein
LLLLGGITVLVLGRNITSGDFWWSDAARHAMDGVFLYDFVRDAPLDNGREYALRYYAQYPALGFAFYPPFFAVVEALFFAVLGISPFAARLTVLAFALVAVLLWYQWMQRLAGSAVAFVSAILLITAPTVVLWAREVMLEIPALSLVIASCFFVDRFIHTRNPRALYLGVILAGLAAWTKQTALFIVPVLAIYLTLTETPRFWLTRPAWIATLWGTILLAPLGGYTLYFGGFPLAASLQSQTYLSRYSLRAFTFYLTELPPALGTPVCVLSCLGLYSMIRSAERRRWALLFIWTVIYYFFAWFISLKTNRYITFWLPPFALFAGWGATHLAAQFDQWRSAPRPLAYSLLALLCGYRVIAASTLSPPFVSGYEPAAAYVAAHSKEQVILFDGYYAGCFIFHLRRFDPRKSRIVLRADKLFHPKTELDKRGQALVHSPNDIRRWLDEYGVNQIVTENGPPLSPASRMLREMLNTKDFALVKRWRLISRGGHNVGDSLRLYERTRPVPPRKARLHIPIPAFGRVIQVPLRPLSVHMR